MYHSGDKTGRQINIIFCITIIKQKSYFTPHLTDLHDLGYIVAGIYCVLDRTNVGSIPLATVGTSKRLPSDM